MTATSETSTMSDNFGQLIQDRVQHRLDADCFIRPGQASISYGELLEQSARIASRLAEHGVDTGHRVMAQVEKSPEVVALYLACLRLGAALVPLNTAYTSEEMAYFVGNATPTVLVCDPESAPVLTPYLQPGASLLTLDAGGAGSLSDNLAEIEPYTGFCEVAADDLAAIVYTSGTTGRSKGAMLSHSNLASSALTMFEAWGWQDDDVLIHALPVFHVHGLFVALHCALLGASPMIWLAKFDAARVVQLIPRATVLMGVPTFYTRLLDQAEFTRERTAGMRLFVSGSAPLTEQVFGEFETRTGQRILERYGMSETMMNTSNPLDGERVGGTVGFPLPGVELRIADEAGDVVATGEIGGVEVRGPNVMSGYWQMPEKTAEEFRADGFFKTGDLGIQDEDGRVTLVGRDKDLVISGGYNVYPKEIERLIDEIPGITESAVIGVPHRDFGEAVVAVIVCDNEPVSQDTVISALQGKLARFKQPKQVIQVDALPRNAMGKVQKKALREEYASLFSSS